MRGNLSALIRGDIFQPVSKTGVAASTEKEGNELVNENYLVNGLFVQLAYFPCLGNYQLPFISCFSCKVQSPTADYTDLLNSKWVVKSNEAICI